MINDMKKVGHLGHNTIFMKSSFAAIAGISMLLASASVSLAAGAILRNGGLGQIAGNIQNFGVAACNGGTKAVSQSVPISVVSNGATVGILSASPIGAGACTYSYLSYSQFGMQAGKTYPVTVTIDPAHTLATNKDNQTIYSVTVPGVPAASAESADQAKATADANAQSGSFFSMMGNWLTGLLKGL